MSAGAFAAWVGGCMIAANLCVLGTFDLQWALGLALAEAIIACVATIAYGIGKAHGQVS